MYNHRMLTLAREMAGMTQVALAHAVGMSQSAISQAEHGFEEPSRELFERMAAELDVPVEFFFQPEHPIGEGLVDFFHRRRRTLPARPLKRAHAFANVVRLELLRLFRTIELTNVSPFPSFSVEDHSPVEAAQMVRATWRVPPGPMPGLIQLVEAAAVPVVRANLGHEKLGAISMPGLEGRHIIVLNEMMPASNLRWGMAHELGHLVMHVGSAVSPNMEDEADEFAAELLMPRSDIGPQLRGVRFRDMGDLKREWHVSIAALTRRAHDLGCISQRQYRSFHVQINKLPGGRKHEPGEFPHERPQLVRSVIEYFKSQLGYSLDAVAKIMVATSDGVRVRYLGEASTSRVRGVGRPDNLYPFPLPARS